MKRLDAPNFGRIVVSFFEEYLPMQRGLSTHTMRSYRDAPPATINGSPVVKLFDYQLQQVKDLKTGATEAINLPKSNVLQFILADGSKISARPSGTEPKIKFYFSVQQPLAAAKDFDQVNAQLDERVQKIIKDMKLK